MPTPLNANQIDTDLVGGGYPGQKAVGWILMDGAAIDGEDVTIGGRSYEFDVINTDSGEDTAGGAWNNVTDPLVNVLFTGHGRAAGDLIRVGTEIMRVTIVDGVDNLTLARGVCGTTNAVHADAQDIFTSATAPGFTGDVGVGLVADLTADAAIDALVATINEDALAVVEAEAMTGNADAGAGALLIQTSTGTAATLAEALTNGSVSAAALVDQTASTSNSLMTFHSYTVTAEDVVQLALANANEIIVAAPESTTAPVIVGFMVRTSANALVDASGVVVRAAQVNSNNYGIIVEDGAAALTAGDIITFATMRFV